MYMETEMEQYKKAQDVNIKKLAELDAQSQLSAEDKVYRAKIQTQFDIIEPKLNN